MTVYLEALWAILLSLAPWLLLGAVIAGLLHGLLPSNWIQRQFQGRSGVLKAVALGVPLPLCSCGVIPAGLGLKKEGASDGAAVGFLISTPQTGVDSILVSASFLGWPFALFKVVAAAVTGVVGGWLTDAGESKESIPQVSASETSKTAVSAGEMFEYAFDILRTIWRWLAFGVLASAAITTWIPAGSLAAVGDWPPLLVGMAALTFSLPLYVCATASVPIAAALVGAGVPAGAALVFLMAGPASNVATIGAVYRGLGRRPLVIYLATLMIGSVGLGLLFDFLVPVSTVSAVMEHHVAKPWEAPSAVLLIVLLVWFAITDLLRWWRLRFAAGEDRQEIAVEGMTCEACVAHVEKAVLGVAGVQSATADLSGKRVVVQGAADLPTLRQAIAESGYKVSD